MTGYPYERRPRPRAGRRRRRLRRTVLRVVAGLVVIAAVFALGVALGEALKRDSPPHGRMRTSVRTLQPLAQQTAP